MNWIRRRWRASVGVAGFGLLGALAALVAVGFAEPAKWWSTGIYAFGYVNGSKGPQLPPFGPLSNVDVWTVAPQNAGNHFYLLGSDPGGRDLLGLVAHATIPSLELVAIVVAARLLVGLLAGLAMGLGSRLVASISDGIGSWIIGFPYLALAIVVIEALAPRGKEFAFVVGMSIIGWRDIAVLVAETVERVRTQPFSIAADAMGTGGLRFFQLHVVPFLRPVLTIEIAFQASAVLVLLAELGYLQVFLGPVLDLRQVGDNTIPLITQLELGQLLALSRRYILYKQMGPVLVPAFAVVAMALAFELVGTALRGRSRFSR
jgi:ABC-type dipeptide/oligopeptide/nickel transport system permease subunit